MAVTRPLPGPRRSGYLTILGVARLDWGKLSLVMALALDLAGETNMLNDGLAQPTNALFLANSGASGSTGDAWLAALNPRLALNSVCASNPAPPVLALLSGRDVLRTDQNGAITVETDGNQLWVGVAR